MRARDLPLELARTAATSLSSTLRACSRAARTSPRSAARRAPLPLRRELHLALERVAELRRAPDGVVLVARVAEADLRAADLDLPAQVDDLALALLEEALVLVELRR